MSNRDRVKTVKAPSKIAPGKSKKKTNRAKPDRRARINWNTVAIVFLFALMAAQMIWMARTMSATMDEQNHIVRGVTYLRTGDLRLARMHPPLINLISALPLALDKNIVLPLDHSSWQVSFLDVFADEFLWKANPNGHSMVFKARLPIIALTLLLAFVAWAWARELYGDRAALVTLTLVAFSPSILAHGSLATNDLGFTCFAVTSAYTFWRWLQHQTWGRAAVAGIALGLALASKFSAVFLLPSLPLMALAHWLTSPREERTLKKIARLSVWIILVAVAGALALWAVYEFKVGSVKEDAAAVPASHYISEIGVVINRIKTGNPTFLLGSYSDTGWWYYFPVAFGAKTPLPTLALIVASLVYWWRRRAWRAGLPLLIPTAIYFAISLGLPLNIGYRHLIPALVFLLIFAGQIAETVWQRGKWRSWAMAVALVWLVMGTASVFPHHLAYFNEAAGGPEKGYKVLVDSNLDWGQDLPGLREYMQREGIESVKLSYFGSADPEAYGIRYEPLPSFPRYRWNHDYVPPQLLQPEPGIYAISVTNLQGALLRNHDLFAWFRNRKPDAIIGHSIFIYRLKA